MMVRGSGWVLSKLLYLNKKIMIGGPPGSGKSTLAKAIFNSNEVLEFDSIIPKYGSYYELLEYRDEATKYFLSLIDVAKPRVVVDVFSSIYWRLIVSKIFQPDIYIEIHSSLDTCLYRNKYRIHHIPEQELIIGYMRYQPIDTRIEHYDMIIHLSTCAYGGYMSEDTQESVYLKIVNNEVLAFGDEVSVQDAEELYKTGRLYDLKISADEWSSYEGCARLIDGKIVFGMSDEQKYARNAEVIRNERYLRLRACDKISPMRWLAMDDKQKQSWIDYRQALLDIPQQAGFPWNGDINSVPWPTQPT